MKQDWFSRLYENELKSLKSKIKELNVELESEKSEISELRKRDYKIYKKCLYTAYYNDVNNNREKKVTSDELSIILTLAKQLDLSQEEIKFINYSVLPIKKIEIQEIVNQLKNMGILFFFKKRQLYLCCR